MNTRTLLLGAVASFAFAGTANAAHFHGWYVGLEGGVNWIDDVKAVGVFDPTAPGPNIVTAGTTSFDSGWAVLATTGYAFSDHWRMEAELGYRHNDTTSSTPGTVAEWSLMVNALYDIHLSPSIDLTLGAGAGYDRATLDIGGGLDDTDGNFAYQGIAGLSWDIGPRTDLTLTYRYLNVQSPSFAYVIPPPGGGTLSISMDDVVKHTVTIGLRYDMYPDEVPAPPPPPPPPPMAPPPPPSHFVIYFGADKCNISPEADAVLSEAASAAKASGAASVSIVGHTDTVGSNAANQKLSVCRADAAKINLVGKGVAASAISASGKGETELAVQTGDKTREPQNNNATIDLH